MIYMSSERHKKIMMLIDAIRRAPAMGQGVHHRANILRDEIARLPHCDGVYQVGDLYEVCGGIIDQYHAKAGDDSEEIAVSFIDNHPCLDDWIESDIRWSINDIVKETLLKACAEHFDGVGYDV